MFLARSDRRAVNFSLSKRRSMASRSVWTRTLIALIVLSMLAGAVSGTGAAKAPARPTPIIAAGPVHVECPTQIGPQAPAYDPADRLIYVPDHSAKITVLTGRCTLVTNIAVPSGGRPAAAVFDPQNNYVYVTDSALNQVYVISGTAIVSTISGVTTGLVSPQAIAFDPGASLVLVANTADYPVTSSTNVTAIQGTSVVGLIPVGTDPSSITYDPLYSTVLITNSQSDNVTALQATDPFASGVYNSNSPVGVEPESVVFDTSDNLDYVVNSGSDNISIVDGDGNTMATVGLTTCSSPTLSAYSQATQRVYVVCHSVSPSGTSGLVELNGTTVVKTVAFSGKAGSLVAPVYDDQTHGVYVSDDAGSRLFIVPGDPLAPVPSPGGPAACGVGLDPYFPGFDPVNNEIYVPNFGSGNLSVVAAPCTVVATITFPPGAEPYAAAFDPQNNFVYVTDENLSQVYVINGTSIVATLSGGWFSSPRGISFVPVFAGMVVANYGSGNVTDVFGTSEFSALSAGSGPVAVVYDPFFESLMVTDLLGASVTLYDFSSPLLMVTTVATGSGPWGIAFNPVVDADLVANEASANLSILSGAGTVYGSQSEATGPIGVVWAQAHLEMYVANFLSHSVWVLTGGSWTAVQKVDLGTGAFPIGLVYDGATGQVYVTNSGSGTLQAID
jgi:DNA-binding beta-propeller fold protein YncE